MGETLNEKIFQNRYFISGFGLVGPGSGYLLWLKLVNSDQTTDSYNQQCRLNIFYILQNVKHLLSDVNFFFIFLKKFCYLSHLVILYQTPSVAKLKWQSYLFSEVSTFFA